MDIIEHVSALCVRYTWTISSQLLLSSSFSDKEIELHEVKGWSKVTGLIRGRPRISKIA